MRPSRRCALLSLPALLCACAAPALPPHAIDDPALSAWTGRFSVSWAELTPPRIERASGSFSLTDSGGSTALEVYSPLGQTIARARVTPDGATLETTDGRQHNAANPEALTESVLGWRIPVGRLPAWLAPTQADTHTDDGWRVRIDARDASGAPRRLTLHWPDEFIQTAPRSVTIRLLIDDARHATPVQR